MKDCGGLKCNRHDCRSCYPADRPLVISDDLGGCDCEASMPGNGPPHALTCPRYETPPAPPGVVLRTVADGGGYSEAVNHPDHYGGGDNPYEVIKVILAWGIGFCLGNTVKYIARAGKKNPAKRLEDLHKARWYLDREIKELESQ